MGNTSSQFSPDGTAQKRRNGRRLKSFDDSIIPSSKDGQTSPARRENKKNGNMRRTKSVSSFGRIDSFGLILSKRQTDRIEATEWASEETLDQILEFVQTVKEQSKDGDDLLRKFVEQRSKKSEYNLKKALEEDEEENIFIPSSINVPSTSPGGQPKPAIAKGA
ncbi:expressed unknown protein [Seminavis robusta]|uniref:Uncharacterized protein n=1 Tax=Seminavis robusta TaxID=568900 RepID=A0A9N8D916_9STRA|nr:expressed unknown protein [Seminavis robusta]|eukprot:Sro42_g025750.1 n/a (164) ;mRNA; r:107108-107599